MLQHLRSVGNATRYFRQFTRSLNFQCLTIGTNTNTSINPLIWNPSFIVPPNREQSSEYQLDSVMRKRRTKMKKHKLRKRRKKQKAEKRKQSQGK